MDSYGIDVDVFEENQRTEIQEVTCSICMNVLLDPVFGNHCNTHVYCKLCIQRALTGTAKCPLCRADMTINDVGIDYSACRKVNKLVALCLNGGDTKCDWRGPYGNLKHHQGSCLFKEINCEHCGLCLERRQHLPHLGECPKMEQPCMTCHRWVKRDEMGYHDAYICNMNNMPCPLGCQQVILRKDSMHHILADCTNHVMVCPIPGCGRLVQDVHAHNSAEGEYHTFLLLQNGTNQMKMDGPIHSFTYKVDDITRMVKSTCFKTGQHDFKVMVLPPDRDVRDDVGVFFQLNSGPPTIVNMRVKISYGNFTGSLVGILHFKTGEVKGWSSAMKAEVFDRVQNAANLELNFLIQHNL
ncbi:TRAF4 [Branchiostoma lanceolatum]|uniref:TRAF4 protein n=1 Tax=Branchiostoma lanceolatum TaxID=7740 RepID=A0A8S4MN51_BRALA|nr:TRAF4 [Branchiostoma lanceolatum]